MLQVLVLLCFIINLQSLSAFETSNSNNNLTLDLVQVIFRHGIRTPSKEEAKYANITDPDIYGLGFGQLTKDGMMQPYVLGSLLRARYNNFLGSYDFEKIEARSSPYARTKMSLELLLASLYVPTENEQWNPKLNWMPIPIDYATGNVDPLLAPHQSSQFSKLMFETLKSSDDYQKELTSFTEFLNTMTKLTGYPFMDNVIYHVGWCYYLVTIHKIMNLKMPSWYTDEVYHGLESMLDFNLNSMSWTTQLKKLNGGPLIKKVIENVENLKNKKSKKIHLYSTHDLTLGAFVRAQGIKSFKNPPFGSAYIIETLSNEQQDKFIKMYSWDGSSKDFIEMKINNCENLCPMEKYKNSVKDVILTDEDLKSFYFTNTLSCESWKFNIVLIVVSVIGTTIVIAAIILLIRRMSRR